MRLSSDNIHNLSERVIRKLQSDSLIEIKGDRSDIARCIGSVLTQFQELAAEVDQGVRKLMEQYSGQIQGGNIDAQQIYSMIRKQVAKEKKYETNPEEQVNVIAHQIHDRIYNDDLVDYTDEDKALKAIKQTLNETLNAEEALDKTVRAKLSSLKRNIPEGSPEWETLYRQYMDEELNKKGL